ncbi:hypothetical protein CIL05_17200 [Virgibacillus profundi]|uniref:DnaB/C C-terminal domain-containing protein n=1 Tax=Virgibacillus profundi TaxID=2024555 RepID=A0A2A2I9G7_9BACI|nr:DnaD domain protein [Virgibacillus profundi]PAV28369.1 hypothetical protein CIL05_17200 [Virgibacillus profundi]PXY52269.1 DnaD domain protein [Virgibacillus profundi]
MESQQDDSLQRGSTQNLGNPAATDQTTAQNDGKRTGQSNGYSSDRNSGYKTDHNSGPFFKQDNTKEKQNKTTATAADAIQFFKDNFGGISPFISGSIQSWVDETNEQLVLHAMELSVEQGVLKWRYVKGILEAWKVKGISSVEAAIAEEKPLRDGVRTGAGKVVGEKGGEIVPDWFVKRKEEEWELERRKQEELRKRVMDPVVAAREAEEIREMIAGLG